MQELKEKYEYILEIKKSRFIARAFAVTRPADALQRIETERDPTATHNCYAFRIGDIYRFSDDGEPGGTAGRPILAAIEKQGMDNCLVLVTRFFGGIKLGAGGLARAYGGAAATCLREAPTREIIPMRRLQVTVPFDAIGDLYTLLKQHGAKKIAETYLSDGVLLDIEIEAAARGVFEEAVADITRGKGTVAQ
jgi:uncharacterized YigZ family protein